MPAPYPDRPMPIHPISRPPQADAAENEPVAQELDATATDHFARFGWAAVPRFFSESEMEDILRWTDEVAKSPEQAGAQMLYREKSALDTASNVIQRIENFCPHHEAFDQLIRRGRLQRAVGQLLGGLPVLFKDKINFKMPGGAGFELHQDQQAGWSAYAPLFVTAMVSIDPATVDNGCLELAAMLRQTGLIGSEWAPLTVDEIGKATLTPVSTRPGDALFFDSFVPHASKPNLTRQARRVLYVTFNHAAEGDHRAKYYADKRANFPPDIERSPGVEYRFRV